MNINQLLGEKTCTCGKIHSCDIKSVLIGSGALKELANNLGTYEHILLVADKNTYVVCGEKVKEQLGEKTEDILIYECEGYLIPNEIAAETLEKKVTKKTDLIIGVGSGVIQDLCKYVSYHAKLPYAIVATAPSMDGYASVGAAMIIGNMKVTYSCHVPEMIIGDTDILKDAPMEMIQAGYGDILGKFSCLNDWKLSHIVNDEYFCEEIYQLTFDMLKKTKDLGEALQNRQKEAVQTLMEALVGVGIAMAYAGNSRPASGSEHHLSHFFEVVGILNKEPYFAHGIDVVYSSIYTQRLREELLVIADGMIDEKSERIFCWEDWEKNIREIYTDAADGVIALQKKLGWYNSDKRRIYKEKWREIKSVLQEAPTEKELMGYLKQIGLDINQFDTLYGNKKINHAIRYAKDLKDRYTVLWLYYDLYYKF